MRAVAWVALAALLAGCDDTGGSEPRQDGVVDDVGSVHARHPPRSRIISLIPAVTEILVELGAGDRLIARTLYDEQAQLASLPVISGALEPSVEALADLDPDLVIMWPTGGDGGPVGERLRQVGLPWYAAAINTVADFERHTANLGELLGQADRADSMIASVRGELVAARELWSGRAPAEIFYVVQKEPPMTVGPGTFLDSIFAAGGAVNSFRDVEGLWPAVSLEQIIWRDPDHVVVSVEGYGTPRVPPGARDPSADGMAALFGWAKVPAIAAGRVITVDASLFGRPGPRMGEAARYLAFRIHGVREVAPAAPPSSR